MVSVVATGQYQERRSVGADRRGHGLARSKVWVVGETRIDRIEDRAWSRSRRNRVAGGQGFLCHCYSRRAEQPTYEEQAAQDIGNGFHFSSPLNSYIAFAGIRFRPFRRR